MPAAHRRRAASALGALAVVALVLTACGGGSGSGAPTWTPKPSFTTEGNAPPGQQPTQPGLPTAPPSGSSSQGSQNTSPVVATRLSAPTAVTIMPDGSALVGERTTGRIVRVQPEAGHPTPTVRRIRGLSTVGGGGLLDIAISPNYAQDNLLFAYVTTAKDNRVIAFTLHGPVTPVLAGIPRGRTGNAGRIMFAADGSLLVATGDAGRPALAANPAGLAGKILRVTDIGRPAAGNPTKGSPVYASGFRSTSGLCTTVGTIGGGPVFQVGPRPDEVGDPIFQIRKAGRYGWPTPQRADVPAAAQLPAKDRSPGGCAVQRTVFYATSLDGKALLSAPVKVSSSRPATLGRFSTVLRNKYGRLRTVVAAPDGALWVTTANREAGGTPVPTDDRVLRIVPPSGGGGSDTV